MPGPQISPDQSGQVADAVTGNWVDTLAPAWTRPYLRLSRADRPIGTWLLYLPCVWGTLLAMFHTGETRLFDAWIVLGCGIGAFLMRGAGCTWNDITDRDFDGSVARTASRPIPSGQVTVKQALAWAVIQSLIAFCILITFPVQAILLGIIALGNIIWCVVNFDTDYRQSGFVEVPKQLLGLTGTVNLRVTDLLTGQIYHWFNDWNYVELNPDQLPGHIFKVELNNRR